MLLKFGTARVCISSANEGVKAVSPTHKPRLLPGDILGAD